VQVAENRAPVISHLHRNSRPPRRPAGNLEGAATTGRLLPQLGSAAPKELPPPVGGRAPTARYSCSEGVTTPVGGRAPAARYSCSEGVTTPRRRPYRSNRPAVSSEVSTSLRQATARDQLRGWSNLQGRSKWQQTAPSL
jgi:hypothetical protein